MTHPAQAPAATSAPIVNSTTDLGQPTSDAHITHRLVSFIVYCAPLDGSPNHPHLNAIYDAVHPNDPAHWGVTDSASYLSNLPYVVVDADTRTVIYPQNLNNKSTRFPQKEHADRNLHDGSRFMHRLGPIHIPDNVRRIALHIGNDGYISRRHFQLFPFDVPDASHTIIRIYEIRSDLQSKFGEVNNLGTVPDENTLKATPNIHNEYYGYLTGDLWRRLSHEYNSEIASLCPPETLTRDPVHGQTQETLAVDWSKILAPIYNYSPATNPRSLAAFSIQIQELDIKVTFIHNTFANAINCSTSTTVQQAMHRTSLRTFAALFKAAWHLHIDTLDLSSSWRPMLGSILHKKGDALDVTQISDTSENITNFTIHNHTHQDRNHPFPNTPGGQKLKQLYDELDRDHNEVAHSIDGAVLMPVVYTPWIHWKISHDNHMHITVIDPATD